MNSWVKFSYPAPGIVRRTLNANCEALCDVGILALFRTRSRDDGQFLVFRPNDRTEYGSQAAGRIGQLRLQGIDYVVPSFTKVAQHFIVNAKNNISERTHS